MDCPSCQTTNPALARFCLGCGKSLVNGLVCPTCFTALPSHARYCFHCGDMLVVAGVRCVECGANVPVGQTFCGVCGTPVAKMQPSQPPVSTTTAPNMSPDRAAPSESQPAATGDFTLNHLPTPRPFRDMLPSLKRYLPQDFYEPMERRPTERDLAQARDHLTALLATTKTYLPYPVTVAPQPPGEPRGGMFKGAFLFVDVSGFTPLSEQLRQFGKLGAERITSIINDLFSDMVAILFDHGGILIKFGGDALLGLFPAETEADMSRAALHAVQAAFAMQSGMSKFAQIEAGGEVRALRVKCGISSGPFFAAHIGTRQNMMYITTGSTVNRAEQAEAEAEAGEVVVAQQTYNLLRDQIKTEPRGEGFYLVHEVAPAEESLRLPAFDEPPEGSAHAQITYLVERMDRLAPYLPAELINRIVTNPDDVRIAPDHRPVTVMFANYVGMSELIEDMGETNPDVITYHLNQYFVKMAQVVERYEGTVARMDQYAVGDRLVIFFGAPRAHEDDPVRAVYTALEMQQAMRENFAALKSPKGVYRFEQRIGINTGSLFAGNVGAANLRQEYTLMGDDINMAARLMSKADWSKIYISKKTRERVSTFFDLQDLGDLKVKGKTTLIPTFEVLGRRSSSAQTQEAERTDVRLIGHEAYLDTAQNAFRALLNGRGQILSIIGDGGLGKTRLTRELRSWFLKEKAGEIYWQECQGLSFSEQISYWLAGQMLLRALDLKPDANKNDVLYTLWETSEDLLGKVNAREATPFLAYLMGLELDGDWAKLVNELDPQVRQKQIFWAVREFFIAKARRQPTVIVLDDLHWSDEASLALVENLFEVTIHAPLMLCLVFRPKRDKGCWRLKDRAESSYYHRYTEVELEPLDCATSGELLARLLPGATFSPDAEQEILDKSAGNPFYLAEVVRSLVDIGAVVMTQDGAWQVNAAIEEIAVPDTLQGAIIARIDRLTEDARQALQMAAVIGRRFQMQVLSGLTDQDEELAAWLAQLEANNLILPDDLTSDQIYFFLDTLVQEVAYENLLTGRRQVFHRRVGEILETLLAGHIEQECELLAYHFCRSDDERRAVKYLEMAGRKAQSEFANATAVEHYTRVLQLMVEDDLTWQKRFDVLNRRQQVYGLLAAQDEREADLRAMNALALAHHDEDRLTDALNGLADLFQWTGRYEEAEATAREALALDTRLNDEAGQAVALHQLGVLAYYRGEYDQAKPTLEQAVALRRALHNTEGEAWSVMYVGMIQYAHGNYPEASQLHEYALALAQARQDVFQVGIHLTNAARVSLRLGEYDQALDQFQRSLEMKRRVGDRLGQGFNLYNIGLTYNALGLYDAAEKAFRDSLELRRIIEDERGTAYSLQGLGLVALARKQYANAEDLFTQAHDISVQLGLKAEVIAHLSYMGQAYLGLDKLDDAVTVSSEAMQLLLEQIDVQEEQQMYVNHFRVLAAANDPKASDYLQLAYDEIMKQGGKIKDDDKRQRFLAKSKINQEILAEVESGKWAVRALS
jgi:class 3 adenylate cyclase/tetratricopeptide (TPR) repeat protein